MSKKPWNCCDVCGRFIAMEAFADGGAVRREICPDSEFTREEWETLCPDHRNQGGMGPTILAGP